MKFIFIFCIAATIANPAYAQYETKIEEDRYLKIKAKKFGVTDSLNKIIIPFAYDYIEYKNNRLIVTKGKASGLITTNNKPLVPIAYTHILPRAHNRFILWAHNGLNGLCDGDGKIIIPVKYPRVSSIANDDFYITENTKKLNGVYDFYGTPILPEVYQFFTVDNYKLFALIDDAPQIIDLQNLDNILHLDTGISFIKTFPHYSTGEKFFQIVKKQNKWGLINADNQIIIPIIYDEVSSSQHWKYYIIKKDGKQGLIHVNGKIIKEPVYDAIQLRKEYIVLKRKNQKDETYAYENY